MAERMLTERAVLTVTDWPSRRFLDARIQTDGFPKPAWRFQGIGDQWRGSDVDAWIGGGRATPLRRELGLYTEEEVAEILSKEVSTLQKMRTARQGPRWLKHGRTILYRRVSLEEWLVAQEARSPKPDPRAEDEED